MFSTTTLTTGLHTVTARYEGLGDANRPSTSGPIVHQVRDNIAPTWTVTNMGDADGSPEVWVQFSEPVKGITAQNVVLRVAGTTTNLPVSLFCIPTSPCSATTGITRVVMATPVLTLGERYQVEVNPPGSTPLTDLVGNARSGTSTPLRITVRTMNQPPLTVTWPRVTSSGALGGSYAQERTAGATVTLVAPANGNLVLLTRKGPNRGQAEAGFSPLSPAHEAGLVVDTYAPTSGKLQVPVGYVSAGDTVTLKVLGTRNASSTSEWLAVDGFTVGATNVDDLTLPRRWAPLTSTVVRSLAKGATVTFSARTTALTVNLLQGPDQGKVRVTVDGVATTFDQYATAPAWGIRTLSGLTDTVHTVEIRVLGTKRTASTNTFVTLGGVSVA